MKFNIALDGPSGAGKSSAADLLAEKYELTHLDTGAMYRAAALYLKDLGLEAKEGEDIAKALESLELAMDKDQIYCNGENVSKKIRQPEVSLIASSYSALPSVRKAMVKQQQAIASAQGYILDGRDICDVVLPDAQVKIYLDSRPEARAKRRWLQDMQQGLDVEYDKVLSDILKRDEQDRNRKEAPLRISKDAVYVDSSDLTLEETVKEMEKIIDQTLQKGSL